MKSNKNIIILKNNYILKFKEFNFKCSIGKRGLAANKIEGDNKTPKGLFKLGNLYYRKDRVKKPTTSLICKAIKPSMRWCNDITNVKYYNKLVNNNNVKSEKLCRNDYKYDYLIVINFNIEKKIVGKGSAIFIHLTQNYKPTAGCVALSRKDFLILAKLIDKRTKIRTI